MKNYVVTHVCELSIDILLRKYYKNTESYNNKDVCCWYCRQVLNLGKLFYVQT